MALGLTIEEKKQIAKTIETRTGKKITSRELKNDVEFLKYITSTLSNNTIIKTIRLNTNVETDTLAVDSLDTDLIISGGTESTTIFLNKLKWSPFKRIMLVMDKTLNAFGIQNVAGYKLNGLTDPAAGGQLSQQGLAWLVSTDEKNAWITDLSVSAD